MAELNRIRNFSIIAHIDHGKSTLADRLMELTETVSERDSQEQLLDNMDLERERGITIKSHPVRMRHHAKDGLDYEFNLIDTPGHVDFTYEVSRSLGACEGALLLIDATQGVQAQTVANVNLAFNLNLEVIPVINKIDLPATDLEMCYEQMEEVLAIPREEALLCSAKEGTGIEDILEAVVKRIPPPKKPEFSGSAALIFDSTYDAYRGVVIYVRMIQGEFQRGTKIRLFNNQLECEIKEVGYFNPKMTAAGVLSAGAVGYIIPILKVLPIRKSAIRLPTSKIPAPSPYPVSRKSTRWFSAEFIRLIRRITSS